MCGVSLITVAIITNTHDAQASLLYFGLGSSQTELLNFFYVKRLLLVFFWGGGEFVGGRSIGGNPNPLTLS